MKQHTADFLAALLWLAEDCNDAITHDDTIYDFSPEMIAAVEAFIDGFLAHLGKIGFDTSKLATAERSLGSNVLFSLGGHSVGFFDDSDPDIAELQNVIQAWAGDLRFHELECSIMPRDDGKIDLDRRPEFINLARARLFAVPRERNEDNNESETTP